MLNLEPSQLQKTKPKLAGGFQPSEIVFASQEFTMRNVFISTGSKGVVAVPKAYDPGGDTLCVQFEVASGRPQLFDVHPSQVQRQPPLPGGFKIGEAVFTNCAFNVSERPVLKWTPGVVRGLTTPYNPKNLLASFEGTPLTVNVTVNVPLNWLVLSLPALPGGYQVNDVCYTLVSHEVSDNRNLDLVPGERGVVLGPSKDDPAERCRILVKFDSGLSINVTTSHIQKNPLTMPRLYSIGDLVYFNPSSGHASGLAFLSGSRGVVKGPWFCSEGVAGPGAWKMKSKVELYGLATDSMNGLLGEVLDGIMSEECIAVELSDGKRVRIKAENLRRFPDGCIVWFENGVKECIDVAFLAKAPIMPEGFVNLGTTVYCEDSLAKKYNLRADVEGTVLGPHIPALNERYDPTMAMVQFTATVIPCAASDLFSAEEFQARLRKRTKNKLKKDREKHKKEETKKKRKEIEEDKTKGKALAEKHEKDEEFKRIEEAKERGVAKREQDRIERLARKKAAEDVAQAHSEELARKEGHETAKKTAASRVRTEKNGGRESKTRTD